MRRAFQLQNPGFRRAVVALVLAHLLLIMAMAASPELHKWIHQDADDDDHDCAVTLFIHGASSDAPVAAVVVAVFAGVFLYVCKILRLDWVENPILSSLILEHAPPACA